MSQLQRARALRRDPVDRPGGPGRPGTAQPNRPARRCEASGLDSAGARRLGRPGRAGRPRSSSSEPRRPSTSAAPTRAASRPGLRLRLWINYSAVREQPPPHAGDLPAVRRLDQDRVADARALECRRPATARFRVTRLGYSQGELVEHVGFWYYIFGEGKLENYVRRLPITSRSSHGRTTRGSSMTVEVFYPGDNDPDGDASRGNSPGSWSRRSNRSCRSTAPPITFRDEAGAPSNSGTAAP